LNMEDLQKMTANVTTSKTNSNNDKLQSAANK
jgi:hypothetical protein